MSNTRHAKGMPADLKAALLAKCAEATERLRGARPYVPSPRGGDGASAEALIQQRDLLAGIADGERRVAAKAKAQVTALCGTKEVQPSQPPAEGPVILGAAQSPDQPKRGSKRDLRHVMATIKERQRKFAAETGFDMFTHEMVEPPMEQWTRPEAMPLYWRLIVSGDSTPPLSALSPGDQDMARWLHDEELVTITGDIIRCLSDCDPVDQRRYPGSPLPDPCHREDGKCADHVNGPCPKIAYTGGPYHAAIGKILGIERAERLVLDAWSAIKAGRPYAQVTASDRGDMTRKGGIRISNREICRHANVRLAQLKALHPEEWAGVRYMSTDVCERAVKRLLDSGGLVKAEDPYLTRIGHTEVGIPRAYAADAEEMAGWLAYAAAGNPRKPRQKARWLRRNLGRAA